MAVTGVVHKEDERYDEGEYRVGEGEIYYIVVFSNEYLLERIYLNKSSL